MKNKKAVLFVLLMYTAKYIHLMFIYFHWVKQTGSLPMLFERAIDPNHTHTHHISVGLPQVSYSRLNFFSTRTLFTHFLHSNVKLRRTLTSTLLQNHKQTAVRCYLCSCSTDGFKLLHEWTLTFVAAALMASNFSMNGPLPL